MTFATIEDLVAQGVQPDVARDLHHYFVIVPRPATTGVQEQVVDGRTVLTVNERIIPNMPARDWEVEAERIEARLTRDAHNLEVAGAVLAYLQAKAETPTTPRPESIVVTALRTARELAWGRLRPAFDQAIAEAQEAEALAGNWTMPNYSPLVLSLAQSHRSFSEAAAQ